MSTIQTTNIKSAASVSNNIVLDGSGNAAFAGNVTAAGNVTSTGMVVPSSSFLRNRIINGDMRIDQRNAGASVTPGNFAYTLDRWRAVQHTASKFSVQQNAGSVTPPPGFTNYIGVTSLSAYSVTSADTFDIYQPIEGFNVADLGWGAAGALTVTLSFWVRSSLTGTFGGVLKNGAGNRSYPFAYTISAANTWEYKTVTIPGDTTGTWLTNNGVGISVSFSLGGGASVSGTAGAWAASDLWQPNGSTSVVGTNGATFYLTGVQLEVGTAATPFERRQFGQELALCERYYSRQSSALMSRSYNYSPSLSMDVWGFVSFPTTMRSVPTVTAIVDINDGPFLSPQFIEATTTSFCFARYALSPNTHMDLNSWTASAEL